MAKKTKDTPIIVKSTESSSNRVPVEDVDHFADPKADLHEILVELALFVRNTAAVLGSTPTARSKHAGKCFDVIDLITRARHLLDEI